MTEAVNEAREQSTVAYAGGKIEAGAEHRSVASQMKHHAGVVVLQRGERRFQSAKHVGR